MLVRLGEPAGPHPRTEPCHARVLDRQPADVPHGPVPGSGSLPPLASSRRKCDLPDLFEPRTATRSPYQTRGRGLHQPGQLEVLRDDRTLGGPSSGEAHPDVLVHLALGGPGPTNFAKQLGGLYREAIPSLYVALTLRVCTVA